MSDIIEQAAQILRTHRIECTGVGEVTCACRNPSDWMSWSDYYRHITQALADAGVLRDSKATAAVDRVRALHYPNTTFGICVEDGDRWPCPTIRTLDAIRLLDSGVDVTVPPEPKYEPGQVVRLRLEDGMPYLAKRADSNDGWEVFGVDVVITDDEVTDVEPVAVLTAEDVRELRKNRGISNFARFFRERGLDL